MNKAATASNIVQAAYLFYDWLNDAPANPQSFTVIHEFMGNAVTLEGLKRLEVRLRNNPDFASRHKHLIERWRERVESSSALSEADALQLMQELFDSFDHSLLYDNGVTAGFTHLQRDSLNHGDKTFSGGMPCWTLHCTVEGKALFLSERMELEVESGDLMLLKPDAHYHYGLHPRASEWMHLWCLFQPRQHWGDLLEWRKLDTGILHLSIPRAEGRSKIESLFREIINLRDSESAFKTDLQYNRLEELLIRTGEFKVADAEYQVDARISQACEYMQARLSARLVVDEVAQACNLSPSRFAHLFKHEMGVGPKSWLNNIRLQQARKLLLASDASVSEIGASVGFEDPGHFTRHFKKSVGCSPRQFRQSFSD